MAQFQPHAPRSLRAPPSAPSSSLVFLRVKRKRQDDPVECLLVPREPPAKQKRPATAGAVAVASTTRKSMSRSTSRSLDETSEGLADIANAAAPGSASLAPDLLDAFTALSTKDRSLVFTRIDTLDVQDDGHEDWTKRLRKKAKAIRKQQRQWTPQEREEQARAKTQQQQRARRHSEIQRLRGLEAVELHERGTLEFSGMHVVDLETATAAATAKAEAAKASAVSTETKDGDTAMVTADGAPLRAQRVLNPFERQIDEAIWIAFMRNDFAPFFNLFASGADFTQSQDPRTFQRPADGGTILMAAAMHGRADVIETLLRANSASVLQDDWNGVRAADFARDHGHPEIETALRACEDVERDREYVYDVYCVDLAASRAHETAVQEDDRVALAPVVALSSAVQRWLAKDRNDQNEDGVDSAEDLMLDSDGDSSDDDGESIDSNDENYVNNDYPDEDSDASNDSDSDDDMGSGGWGWHRRGYEDGEAEEDDVSD